MELVHSFKGGAHDTVSLFASTVLNTWTNSWWRCTVNYRLPWDLSEERRLIGRHPDDHAPNSVLALSWLNESIVAISILGIFFIFIILILLHGINIVIIDDPAFFGPIFYRDFRSFLSSNFISVNILRHFGFILRLFNFLVFFLYSFRVLVHVLAPIRNKRLRGLNFEVGTSCGVKCLLLSTIDVLIRDISMKMALGKVGRSIQGIDIWRTVLLDEFGLIF